MLSTVSKALVSDVIRNQDKIKHHPTNHTPVLVFEKKRQIPAIPPASPHLQSKNRSTAQVKQTPLYTYTPKIDLSFPKKETSLFALGWKHIMSSEDTLPDTTPKQPTPTQDMIGALGASFVSVTGLMPAFTLIVRAQTTGTPPLVELGKIFQASNGSLRSSVKTLNKGIGAAYTTVGISRSATYFFMGEVKKLLPDHLSPLSRDLASGAAASIIKVGFTQPFDRLKVMNQHGHHLGIRDYVSITLRTQGVTGFWAGGLISATKSMGGTPLWLSSKNQVHRLLENELGQPTTKKDKTMRSLFSGFAASILTLPVIYPLDASKSIIMAMKKENGELKTTSLKDVYKEFSRGGASRVFCGAKLQLSTLIVGGTLFNAVQENIAYNLANHD